MVRVDAVFFRRLRTLLKVFVPSATGQEALTILCLTVCLFLRTRFTVVMASLVGDLAKLLVKKDAKGFVIKVLDVGLMSVPSSVVHASTNYLTTKLQSGFRTNLQTHIHKQYSSNGVYYDLNTNAICDTPDQRMTEDARVFTEEVASIYKDTFKPIVDVFTFVYQLSAHGGWKPPVALILYYLISGWIMKKLMPNFAKLTATMQQLEGDLRWGHSEIIQHVEEIAFYRGEARERENVDRSLRKAIHHAGYIARMKAITDFIESVLVKYGATCAGFAVCSIGVFELRGKVPAAELTRVYVQSSQLLLPLARAIGQIVMLYKKLTGLAGYTSRVAELTESLKVTSAKDFNGPKLYDGSAIEFRGVQLQPPSGNILLTNLDLTIKPADPLLIMGTNGSGKTALLRTLAGMWGLQKGVVIRPKEGIFFLSQRCYFTSGTLLEQFVYPQSTCRSEEEIMGFVKTVGLESVIAREGGLHVRKSWNDVLSGGEKQRTSMVRLFYAKPLFGVLDESTCAVSQEIEGALYEKAAELGITLITVSHREGLKKYHNRTLVLDGLGGYKILNNKEE